MKRWSILLLCIITLAAAQAATVRPDLEVTKLWWRNGPSAGDGYRWIYLEGCVVNNSKNKYALVAITASVFNAKKERIGTALACVESVMPGDTCRFLALPGVIAPCGKLPYTGRIVDVKGYIKTE